ncbi:MAG: hypothetical protein AAGK05_15740 [Pseudomonadota bacterium]
MYINLNLLDFEANGWYYIENFSTQSKEPNVAATGSGISAVVDFAAISISCDFGKVCVLNAKWGKIIGK